MSLEVRLNRLFETYGYRRFKMSKFEEYDLYAENRDFLTSSQVITFNDLDGKLLALKPDITLSIIKGTAEPRKVYYNEMVYRVRDRHYREIPQAGVECIGTIDPYLESEVIALAAKALEAVDEDYILRISDIGFIRTYLEAQKVKETYHPFIIDAMAGKNADYMKQLAAKGILTEAQKDVLAGLVELYLPLKKGIKEVRRMVSAPSCKALLDHLDELCSILGGFGVLDHIYLDLSLMNSMDYYNGVVFQGAVSDIPFTVLSGGRYDRLPEKMGKPFGAIGFAVYMDVVENRRRSSKHYDGDILITYTDRDRPAMLAKTVSALCAAGYRVRAVRAGDEADPTRWKKVLTLKEAKKEAGV